MWKRQPDLTNRFTATTDGLAVSISDTNLSVVALMIAPLKQVVIDHPQEGTTSLIFLTATNEAVSVTIQGGIDVLESALATASFAYHREHDDG